jgi:hypothetical protein
MSVPAAVMQKAMQGQGPAQGAQPMPAAPTPAQPPQQGGSAGGQSPGGAPLSGPQDKKGVKAAAQTNIHIAVNMLEEALPAFGSESPEGGKILSALKTLGSMVAKKDTSDLVPAEILQLVKRMPQMGGGTEVQQAIMKQMAQAKQQPAPAA